MSLVLGRWRSEAAWGYLANERSCFKKTESTYRLTPKIELWLLHIWVYMHTDVHIKGEGCPFVTESFIKKKKTIMKQN